jgi:UDP-glucuronate 4-epimerase
MRILLTGSAGFIGSHLAERLCARGDQVVGLDNFDAFYPRAMKERNLASLRARPEFRFVEGDITSSDDLARGFAEARPDAVVHLAALAGVRPSIADPLRYSDVNVSGTVRLLDTCWKNRVTRVVFASSSSVYGADSAVPFRESEPCGRPASPYAATKRAGELCAFTAHHLQSLDVTCLRFFTVYGPRQRPDLAIHKFTRLIDAGKPIELFGDGSTSRDYTWVDDIIDGTVAAIDEQARARVPGYRIYNLGGSRTTSLMRLVELISQALGKKPVIEWRPEQPGDMRRTLADLTLSGTKLGYAPRVAIEDGIARFVSWFKSVSSSAT